MIFLGGKEKMEKWDSATVARDVKDTLEREKKVYLELLKTPNL